MAVNKVCPVSDVSDLRKANVPDLLSAYFSMSSEVLAERRADRFLLAETAHPGHALGDYRMFGGAKNSPRHLRKSFLRKVYTKATFA